MSARYHRHAVINSLRLGVAAIFLLLGMQGGLALTENLIINGDFKPGIDASPMQWQSYAIGGAFRKDGNTDFVSFTFFANGVAVTAQRDDFDMYQMLYLTAVGMDKLRFSAKVGVEGEGKLRVSVNAYGSGESANKGGASIFLQVVTNTAGALQAIESKFAVPAGAKNLAVVLESEKARRFSLASFSLQPVYTRKPDARPIVLGSKKDGQKLSRIWVSRAALQNEMLAARLLRQALFKLTGEVVALDEWAVGKDGDKQGGFFIGRAALEVGLIRAEEVQALPAGGYGIKITNTSGAIYGGKDNLGNVEGVMGLLRELGVRIYTRELQKWPEMTDALVVTAQNCVCRPSLQYSFYGDWMPATLSQYEFGFNYMNDCWADPKALSIFAVEGSWVHDSSFLVSYKKYHDEHPEYFAMAKGKRLELKDGQARYDVHVCLSNPDVHRIAAETLMKWMELQPECTYFCVNPGDGLAYCECPVCLALDPDPAASRTDSWIYFVNGVAERVAKKFPDKHIVTLAYTACTETPPQRVKPAANVDIMYCLWSSDWPCDVHGPLCKLNEEGARHVAEWTRLCPGRVHIFDYPWNIWADLERMRWFKEKGIVGVHHCGFRGTFPLMSRYLQGQWLWNPGMKEDDAINEFMEGAYGAAARSMRQYYDLIEREMAHQQHEKPGSFYPDFDTSPSLITPEFSKQAYRDFDQAVKKAGTNAAVLNRIRLEQNTFLMNDLNQYNKTSGLEGRDLEDFAWHLSEFIRIATNSPWKSYVFYRTDIRLWLAKIARVNLATNTAWNLDPIVLALATNPASVICVESVDQEAAPGGWKIPAQKLWGGDGPMQYAGKTCMIVRRASSPTPSTEARFDLKAAPTAEARLIISGMDDEKPGKAVLRITVNSKEIYAGTNALGEAKWSEMSIPIPAKLLKSGRNTVKVFNTTPDDRDEAVAQTDVAIEAAKQKRKNYAWGWLAISEMRLQVAADGAK